MGSSVITRFWKLWLPVLSPRILIDIPVLMAKPVTSQRMYAIGFILRSQRPRFPELRIRSRFQLI